MRIIMLMGDSSVVILHIFCTRINYVCNQWHTSKKSNVSINFYIYVAFLDKHSNT